MQSHKIYKLDPEGETYQAVIEMEEAIRALHRDFYTEARGAGWKKLAVQLTDKVADWDIRRIEDTGQTHPVIQVKDDEPQGFPRAYAHFPQVYATEFKYKDAPDNGAQKYDLYMYAPVGYDGDHFAPEDARLIDDKREEQWVGNALFAGGWSDPISCFSLQARGVGVPDDYVKPEGQPQGYVPAHDKACFVALGETRAQLDDFEARQGAYQSAADDVMRRVDSIIKNDLGDMIRDQIDVMEEFYMNWSYAPSDEAEGKTAFQISVRQSGNVEPMQGGQPLTLSDNDFFIVQAGHSRGEYNITPNLNTPQGQALAEVFDAVPPKPSLSDYPDLVADFPFTEEGYDAMLGVNGQVPRVQEFQGHKVLIYNTDDADYDGFCPPDSIALPAALYIWLNKDDEDARMGIEPPPAADELAKLNETFETRLNLALGSDHPPLLEM